MTEPNGASITFENVGKAYSKSGGTTVTALEGVSLAMEPGSITGIIGRSGAGKSTLLRMVNGIERPTTGAVLVGGQNVGAAKGAKLRAIRRDVGMIFQHFNLLASRSVAGNIALPLEIAGVPSSQIKPRVADLIERVGLSAHATRYPAELSGGQKQRVGIARALATGPKV
ncbi:MAG TPA: methionine ABC transporter ATP-binding protein, partial [Sulfitobacter pontiacus]|nr:methionine ABC transporter ATP-binding protein [Sulfitobacter pontiacus]